jgi:hypothetical protein
MIINCHTCVSWPWSLLVSDTPKIQKSNNTLTVRVNDDLASRVRRRALQQHVKHLFEINDAFQAAPAATALRIISAMPADQQQRLREALNGEQHSPAQFQQAVQQKAQELAQTWLAQHQLREFESKAPTGYDQVKPLMFALLQNGLATDLKSAYDLAMKPARTATEQTARLDRKTKAANASLNGAPHGVSASPPKNGGGGKFTDVAADVRAAVASLG